MQIHKKDTETSEVNKRQTKVKSFIDNITNSERRKIDKALLYFFIASKLDFKEMESVYFKDFLNVIRPAYTAPNNNYLLNDVLNEAQNVFTIDSLKVRLIPVLLVLKVDESTIISLLRNIENKYVFVNVNKCTETNEYELKLSLDIFIRDCIKYIYESMKLKIHTVVHNLEVTMSDKINVNLENIETEILIFQCHMQYIRSIRKCLIRPELITKVNKLLEAFKCMESNIINLGGTKIVLYNSNSWANYRAVLESCLKNLKSMREIVGQWFKVTTDILQLVFDDFFEQEIEELIRFSLEIENLKSKVLNIQCNIADAIQYWFQFMKSDKNMQYTDILNNIFKSIVSPIHLVSNYLNPKYKGHIFMEKDEYAFTLEEFSIDNLLGEGMTQYTKYMLQTEIFSKLFDKNIDDVMVFWTVAERKYGELAKLAQKLLQIPACVPYTNMNKITQNNLTQDQQEKIKCLFYTLKLNEAES